jgi:hypothetical protein
MCHNLFLNQSNGSDSENYTVHVARNIKTKKKYVRFVALIYLKYTQEQWEIDIQSWQQKYPDHSLSQSLRYGEWCKQRPQIMLFVMAFRVIFYMPIQNAACWNLVRNTCYPDSDFRGFPQFFQADVRISPQLNHHDLLSNSHTFSTLAHYSNAHSLRYLIWYIY